MDHADAIEVLDAVFGPVTVSPAVLPVGALRHVPEALDAIERAGGSDGLTGDPSLLAYIEQAESVGAVDIYRQAVEQGFAWAPCDVCGEVLLRARGDAGRTPSGKLSKAKPSPRRCVFSWTTVTRGNLTTTEHCPGSHVAEAAR